MTSLTAAFQAFSHNRVELKRHAEALKLHLWKWTYGLYKQFLWTWSRIRQHLDFFHPCQTQTCWAEQNRTRFCVTKPNLPFQSSTMIWSFCNVKKKTKKKNSRIYGNNLSITNKMKTDLELSGMNKWFVNKTRVFTRRNWFRFTTKYFWEWG